MRKNKIYLFSIILLTALAATGANAGDAPAAGKEPEPPVKLIREAVNHNPGIAAAKLKWRAAIEDIRLAASLPDPQAKFTDFTDPIETRLGPQEWSLTINQKIPLPAKLAKKTDIAEARAELARLAYEITVRETIRKLRRSFARIVYLRRAETLAAENLALLQKAALLAADPGKEGKALSLDLMRAASQQAQGRYDLVLLREQLTGEKANFNALLGRKPESIPGRMRLAPEPPLNLNLNRLQTLVLSRLEEIRAAKIKIKIAAGGKNLARLGFLPDFSVGLFYAEIGRPDVASPPPDAGRNAMGISGGLTLPLWMGKNTRRLTRAKAEEKSARATERNLENQTRTRVTRLYFKIKNDRRTVRLYRDNLLPQAISQLGTSESTARNELKTLAEHLEALATLYNFRLSLARARSDYHQDLADLEALAGNITSGGREQ